jgi:hypothetical protein
MPFFLCWLVAGCLVGQSYSYSYSTPGMRANGSNRGVSGKMSPVHYIPTPEQLSDPRWSPGIMFDNMPERSMTGGHAAPGRGAHK